MDLIISQKLDQVIAAEEAASARILDAEKDAAGIIAAAKTAAEDIRERKRTDAKAKAKEILGEAEAECIRITEIYKQSADDEAEKIGRAAAKNEIFGMSAVIMKIIP